MRRSKITTKVRLIVVTLSTVLLANILITIYLSQTNEKDSLLINIAGRQRMLSQKISKELFYLRSSDGSDFRILDTDIEEFAKSLTILEKGDEKLGIYPPPTEAITTKLADVRSHWGGFYDNIRSLKQNSLHSRNNKEMLNEKIGVLLEISDKVVQQMVESQLAGRYIDLSGRQRMLSQKMGMYYSRYLRTFQDKDLFVYHNTRDLYAQTLDTFIQDPLLKEHAALYDLLTRNQSYWSDFLRYIETLTIQEQAINTQIDYIYTHNTALLNTMDEAVWLYTNYAETKAQLLKNLQYATIIVGLIIIFSALSIIRDIQLHIDEFVQKAKNLATADFDGTGCDKKIMIEAEPELAEASHHINSFIDRVKSVMGHSTDAIHNAQMAIAQLQAMTDEIEEAMHTTKGGLGESLSDTEDIAIETTENLMHVKKLLQKLQSNLEAIDRQAPQS